MSKNPSEVIPKNHSGGTPSRSYVHCVCGGSTLVDGHEFLVLTDPFSFIKSTMCAACKEQADLADVAWTDTNESIADFRNRVRSELSPFAVGLAYAIGPIVGAVVGGVGGAFWPPHTIPEIFTGVLGGGIIGWLVLQIPARKHLGFDFRRSK